MNRRTLLRALAGLPFLGAGSRWLASAQEPGAAEGGTSPSLATPDPAPETWNPWVRIGEEFRGGIVTDRYIRCADDGNLSFEIRTFRDDGWRRVVTHHHLDHEGREVRTVVEDQRFYP